MIYVIETNDYKCGDMYGDGNVIVYISTDKQAAQKHFMKYYAEYATRNDDCWVYNAMLLEFRDGWNMINDSQPTVLMEASNLN